MELLRQRTWQEVAISAKPAHLQRRRFQRIRRRFQPVHGDGESSAMAKKVVMISAADDLFPLFDKYGKVVDVFIPRDRRTGDSRRFAFVRYKYQDEAAKAVEKLDGRVVDGREIMVQFAKYGPNAERIHKGKIQEPVYKTKGRSRSRSPRPRSRDEYRDRDSRRRSHSRSRGRDRDGRHGRDRDRRPRSRSLSESPDYRGRGRGRYDDARRSGSNWEIRPLSVCQLEFVALHAAVLVKIFRHVPDHVHPVSVADEHSKAEWKSYIISIGKAKIHKTLSKEQETSC